MTHGEGRWEAVWTRNLTVFKHITGTLPFFTDFETDFKTWLVFIFFFFLSWRRILQDWGLSLEHVLWKQLLERRSGQMAASIITLYRKLLPGMFLPDHSDTLKISNISWDGRGTHLPKTSFSENNHPSKSFIGLNDFQCMWNQPTPEREAVMKEQNNVSR